MTGLDVADLVVIAGRALGIGTDVALAQIDLPAAEAALAAWATPAAWAALAEGPPPGGIPDRAAAAAAGIGLVHALLRHPPFPGHDRQLAAAAGLQFLAVNGWEAALDPPEAAAIVIESLASGRLTPAGAAAWLSPRLSPLLASRTVKGPGRALRRSLKSVLPARGPGNAGMSVGGRMLASFTDRAAASISMAQQEARRLGHDQLDPEHLLLGLIRQGEGVAVTALERLGISLDALRQQVEESIGRGQGAPAGPIRPSRPRGQKVLNAALPEALVHDTTDMGTGHLLLAQFHDDGAAAQALARLGAGESEVRRTVTAVLAEAGRSPGEMTSGRARGPR
jgi:hypothetical protein